MSNPFCSPAQFKSAVFYGGIPIKQHKDLLKSDPPHCVVGTPGRTLALIRDGDLKLDKVKHFVLDECDQMLEASGAHAVDAAFATGPTFTTGPSLATSPAFA